MKKNTDYTIHLLIALFLFACFASSCKNERQGDKKGDAPYNLPNYIPSGNYYYGLEEESTGIYPLVKYQQIIELNADERGLISFTFRQPTGDTVGLDYVTVKGFNHWLKGEIDSVYNDIKIENKKILSIRSGGGYFTVISDKVKPFLFAETIDSLQINWEYNIANNLMWSMDSIKLATITARTPKSSHILFIPYKPFGIYAVTIAQI